MEEMSEKEEKRLDSSSKERLSCTKYFDYLGFCYSPVHQMQQYYRHGNFDNCYDKWNALFDCFNLKTKRSSEAQEILEHREKTKPHIWTFRTPAEASGHWNELFGRINEEE